ncbi:MAG: biotin/lipoyl-binding protein [Planctomycetota bacterium]
MEASEETQDSSRPLPVRVATLPAAQPLALTRHFHGRLRAAREVDPAFPLAGTLTVLPIEEGDWVQTGDLLAQLDTRRLQAALQANAAEQQAASARLAELEAGVRSEVRAQVRAAWDAELEQLALARLQLERRRELLARESTSQEEVDAAESRVRTLEFSARGAEARWTELQNGTRPEVLESQRAQIAALAAARTRLEVDLADCDLRAPFAGQIARIHAREGSVLAPGQALCHLVERGRLQAEVGVPGETARELATGAWQILVDDQPVPATRMRELPGLDPGERAVRLLFDLEWPADRNLPFLGDPCQLTVEQHWADPVWWLPLEALTEGVRGLWLGFVLEPDGDEFRLRPVDLTVLHVEGDRCAVQGALAEGDRFLLQGSANAVPGQRVLPVAEGSRQP